MCFDDSVNMRVLLWLVLCSYGFAMINNEVYEVICDDCCPRDFNLYHYEVLNNGCLLLCVFLGSSSKEYSGYYDVSRKIQHRLTSNNCTNDNNISNETTTTTTTTTTKPTTTTDDPRMKDRGYVGLKIWDAYVKDADKNSRPDPYFKVSCGKVYSTTKTYDTHYPRIFRDYDCGLMRKEERIIIRVWDQDVFKDDYLDEVSFTPEFFSPGRFGEIVTFNHTFGWIRISLTYI